MYTFVLAGEKLRELLLIDFKEVAEPLADMAVERQVGTILHATLDNHATEFDFLSGPDLKLE